MTTEHDETEHVDSSDPKQDQVMDTKRNATRETILLQTKSSLSIYMIYTTSIDNIGTKNKWIHPI